jgi:hypothetical protein
MPSCLHMIEFLFVAIYGVFSGDAGRSFGE